MSDTGPVDDGKPIYHHPNIREQMLAQVIMRADERRSRRLMAAIETNNLKLAKIEALAEKDKTKFAKVMERLVKRLDDIRDQLDKVDDEIATATQLHNQAKMLGEQLS